MPRKSFRELTGVEERTPEGIAAIQHAAEVIHASEQLGDELENANYHSLRDDLLDFTRGLHVHKFDGEKSFYSSGDYEVECSEPGCWASSYFEGPGE